MFPAPLKQDITGLVLAGGEGRRMGGLDKGQQLFRGHSLTSWVLARLTPQVSGVIISANRNTEAYASHGWPVVTDQIDAAAQSAPFAGPLAGVLAGLRCAETNWVMTCPCDTPFFPEDLVARLAAALSQGSPLAVAWCHGRPEPAFMLCRQDLAQPLAAYLASGERRFSAWQQGLAAARVDFDDCPEAFANFNTLADLARG